MCTASDRRADELRGNAEKNNDSDDDFARATAREQALKPGAEQPLQSCVHHYEKHDDRENAWQKRGAGLASADRNCQQPADRSHSGKIGQAVCETDEIERREAKWKTQQRAKLKLCAESGHENVDHLPEKKNAPEKQEQPSEVIGRKRNISTPKESETQADHQDAANECRPDHPDQIQAAVFSPKTIALDPKTHHLFVSTAQYGETPAATTENPNPRPKVLPGTFMVLEYGIK